MSFWLLSVTIPITTQYRDYQNNYITLLSMVSLLLFYILIMIHKKSQKYYYHFRLKLSELKYIYEHFYL